MKFTTKSVEAPRVVTLQEQSENRVAIKVDGEVFAWFGLNGQFILAVRRENIPVLDNRTNQVVA